MCAGVDARHEIAQHRADVTIKIALRLASDQVTDFLSEQSHVSREKVIVRGDNHRLVIRSRTLRNEGPVTDDFRLTALVPANHRRYGLRGDVMASNVMMHDVDDLGGVDSQVSKQCRLVAYSVKGRVRHRSSATFKKVSNFVEDLRGWRRSRIAYLSAVFFRHFSRDIAVLVKTMTRSSNPNRASVLFPLVLERRQNAKAKRLF